MEENACREMIYSFTHNFTVHVRNLLSQRPGISDEMRTHYQSSPVFRQKKPGGHVASALSVKSINPFYHQSKLACTESIGLSYAVGAFARARSLGLYRGVVVSISSTRDEIAHFFARGAAIFTRRAAYGRPFNYRL